MCDSVVVFFTGQHAFRLIDSIQQCACCVCYHLSDKINNQSAQFWVIITLYSSTSDCFVTVMHYMWTTAFILLCLMLDLCGYEIASILNITSIPLVTVILTIDFTKWPVMCWCAAKELLSHLWLCVKWYDKSSCALGFPTIHFLVCICYPQKSVTSSNI